MSTTTRAALAAELLRRVAARAAAAGYDPEIFSVPQAGDNDKNPWGQPSDNEVRFAHGDTEVWIGRDLVAVANIWDGEVNVDYDNGDGELDATITPREAGLDAATTAALRAWAAAQ